MNGGSPRFTRSLGLLLALIVVAFLAVGTAARHVSAQDNPDCEDPDTVACLAAPPTPDDGSGAQAGAAGTAASAPAPSAAAAPGRAVPYPGPCPYPPPPPYGGPPGPLPASAGAAAAPPAAYPAPFPCLGDIYGTINRANLAYARAMRNLDGSQLPSYWGGGALRDLRRQIDDLWYEGSYRALRLRSIQIVDQSLRPNATSVHTRERWTSESWSFDGYQYDSADAWYDNYYTLTWAGNHWLITTDVVY